MFRVHSDLGFRRGITVQHAAGGVQGLRGQGRGSSVGYRQTHPDARLHALSGSLGAETFLAGNGTELPYQLGEGLPGGGVRCAVGSGAPQARPDPRYWRGRDPVWTRTQLPDAGLSDRGGLCAPAVGGQGADGSELREVLHPDRQGTGRADRVRLFGHVEALPEIDRKALHQCTQHPGSISCCGKDESGY